MLYVACSTIWGEHCKSHHPACRRRRAAGGGAAGDAAGRRVPAGVPPRAAGGVRPAHSTLLCKPCVMCSSSLAALGTCCGFKNQVSSCVPTCPTSDRPGVQARSRCPFGCPRRLSVSAAYALHGGPGCRQRSQRRDALVQVQLVEGALICPETGRRFRVSKGIPNLLLNEDEC